MTGVALVFVIAGLLAYANGANDVSKGIATLVGSGVTDYRRAMLWGAAWTALGASLASVAAGAMLATFGAGLLTSTIAPSLAAAAAALAGAALWVFVATRAALPVSTTHALVGSLVGAAIAAYGTSGVAWTALGAKVAAPLILSPLVSLVIAVAISHGARRLTRAAPDVANCLCVQSTLAHVVPRGVGSEGTAILRSAAPLFSVVSADAADCRATMPGALRVTEDTLHWMSSGAASFARGLNDAPKIVGFAIAAGALTSTSIASVRPVFFLLVTAGMVIGSLAAGLRVTRVLAEDVTPMSHREGLAANLVTAILVSVGAVNGLAMSTTHVSSGAIMGIGAERGSLNWRTARTIAAAWIVTLPGAALAGAACYGAARLVTL